MYTNSDFANGLVPDFPSLDSFESCFESTVDTGHLKVMHHNDRD